MPRKLVWFSWKDYSNPLAGGAEVVTDQLLRRWCADGNEALLLTSGYPGAAAEETHNGYKIIRVGSRFSVFIAARSYYKKHLMGWADLAIDECNTMPFFAGWYSGVPTTMFFHMLCRVIWFYQFPQPFSLIGWLLEPVYLRLLKRGPVIAMSESTKQDLLRNGFKAKDVTIISEGSELAPIKSLAIEKFPEPTVLSLGSIRPMKRTLDQVKAFEIAKQSIPNLKMVIAGDSNDVYGSKVLDYIKHSKYKKDIAVLGRVSTEIKMEVMQRAHLILVTSVKEGWGLIVTEAASQGTPAVVYDVDGLRDSVKDGVTGVICKESPSSMATAISQLLSDDVNYKKIRKASYTLSKSITFEQSYKDFKDLITTHAKTDSIGHSTNL